MPSYDQLNCYSAGGDPALLMTPVGLSAHGRDHSVGEYSNPFQSPEATRRNSVDMMSTLPSRASSVALEPTPFYRVSRHYLTASKVLTSACHLGASLVHQAHAAIRRFPSCHPNSMCLPERLRICRRSMR